MAPSSSRMLPCGILVGPVATPVQRILKFTFPNAFLRLFPPPQHRWQLQTPIPGPFSQEPLGKTNPEKTKKIKNPPKKREKRKVGRKPPKFPSVVEAPPASPELGIPGIWERSSLRHERGSGGHWWAPGGHWWHWWHWSERPRPTGRSFPPLYSPSAGIRMGMRSRIRLSRCRLLPPLGSVKVFWSGITSVVSWAWRGGTTVGF